MDFKFNKKTRIKIGVEFFSNLRKEYDHETIVQARVAFQNESGLVCTSRRYNNQKHTFIYFFKVLDKSKFFISKIKYGF